MAKNIVICADGTGNAFEKNVSNVTRLVKSLDLSNRNKQLVFYDQGVGTKPTQSANDYARDKPGLSILQQPQTDWWLPRPLSRWLGLGFGYGLAENVKEMYEALATNYKKDDRIFLFGFSRGAFTVRALAGFVHRCGLLPTERLRQFSEAYKTLYEEQHFDGLQRQSQQEQLARSVERFRKQNDVRDCQIHFLGIWDTVKSYGFIYPKSLPHLRHNPIVLTVRHALALDERRSYYQPTSWGGVDHPLFLDTPPDQSIDVQEVWFAGSHSDVGGGYEPDESGLARAPFEWMVREACAKELCLNDVEFEGVVKSFSKDRVLHESLKGFWWWVAECFPRFEVVNIPVAGKRVLKWGSTGQRDPQQFSRNRCVHAHPSAHEVYSSLNRAPLKSKQD